MNAQEILDTALGKCAEFNVQVPSTRSAAFARLTRRQEQLFARAAVLNREFFGKDGELVVAANEVDTQDLNPIPMRVHIVRVANPGASAYPVGQRVAIVHVDDLEAELPPRATMRDGVIQGVASDWTGLTSVRVFYSKRPAEVTMPDDVPELPKQFHELLALDLAKWLIRKTLGITDQSKLEMVGVLETEEKELEADFERFLVDWAFTETSRFGSSARQG